MTPPSRFSPEERQSIRDIYRQGYVTQRELAEKFGVRQSYIAKVIKDDRAKPRPSKYRAKTVKICTKCCAEKPVEDFRWTSSGGYKYRRSQCKDCSAGPVKSRKPKVHTGGRGYTAIKADAWYDFGFACVVMNMPTDKAIDWIAQGYEVQRETVTKSWKFHEATPSWDWE